MTEEIGKVIHDLYEELVEVRKQNVGLRNANEIYSKQNVEFRQNQDQDDLNRQITELKKENIKLVAQLENDEHNVGHLDEKMKRLDYLE